MDMDMADGGLVPPGFCFHPSDELLVVYYLRHYVRTGQSPHEGVVIPADVYGTEPWNLLAEGQEEAFFFARRRRFSAKAKRASRTAGKGSWHSFRTDDEITSSVDGQGQVKVGIKHSLAFKYEGRKHKGWIMYEYELYSKGDNKKQQDFQEVVLCHIKMSDQAIARAQKAKRESDSKKKRMGALTDQQQISAAPPSSSSSYQQQLLACSPSDMASSQEPFAAPTHRHHQEPQQIQISAAPPSAHSSWPNYHQVLECTPLVMVPPQEPTAHAPPAHRHHQSASVQAFAMADAECRNEAGREETCTKNLPYYQHQETQQMQISTAPPSSHSSWPYHHQQVIECRPLVMVPPQEPSAHAPPAEWYHESASLQGVGIADTERKLVVVQEEICSGNYLSYYQHQELQQTHGAPSYSFHESAVVPYEEYDHQQSFQKLLQDDYNQFISWEEGDNAASAAGHTIQGGDTSLHAFLPIEHQQHDLPLAKWSWE